MIYLEDDQCKIIKTESIGFPQFYHFTSDAEEKYFAAIYVTAQADFNSLGLPTHLVIQRETGNGVVTTGTYILMQSAKIPGQNINSNEDFADDFNEDEN